MEKVSAIEVKNCPPHEYKAEKYEVQEAVTYHYNYRDHLLTTLVHERIKLFCVKCGDVKETTNP